MRMIKLTLCTGKPVYVNPDNVIAVHEDMSSFTPNTIVSFGFEYYEIKESVETAVELLSDNM